MKRDPLKFESLNLYTTICAEFGLCTHAPGNLDLAINKIRKSLEENLDKPTIVKGIHTQHMFRYVLAAMRACRLIKDEDSGDLITDEDVAIPDYRVVTNAGKCFFIEVKRNEIATDEARQVFTKKYIKRLRAYCEMIGVPLKIAIHWAPWNLWTLTSVDYIPYNGINYSLSLIDAVKMSEMSEVGDVMIGTLPPLVIRAPAVRTKREAASTKRLEIYASGEMLQDPFERRLAYYMMVHGKWQMKSPSPARTLRGVDAYDFVFEPEMPDPTSHFNFIGNMSQMVTNEYLLHTASEKGIMSIVPAKEPSSFGIPIPHEFRSEKLKLWRLTVQPNYGLLEAQQS